MEEWDDEPTTTSFASNIGVAVEGGRKFSSGRGFKSFQDDGGDTWGSSNTGIIHLKFNYGNCSTNNIGKLRK